MPAPSSFALDGRRAIVTGAGRGLGQAIAAGLAEAGAQVVLVSRDRTELAASAALIGANALALRADVSAENSAADIADQAELLAGGPIDIVVHGAGIQHRAPAEEFDPSEWDHVLATNLTAPFRVSQELGRRQLAAGRKGSHIFIGSISSRLGLPNVAAYSASKAGIVGVVRSLSLEWSGRGIRVNGIGPGYFRTKLTQALLDDSEQRARMLARIPMNRFGEPSDLAGAAVFLASDASSYVTGQIVMVDGGWTSN